ncbi:two-component sensor histidine kinase [Planotetraspora thailandica]|uniref:Signal transduction histidine-protein kinase/phosphatase MprB n=1 Tax=Planotetraspora thailandica TaxID=487172 RepID=A0A8J3V0R3_9ACTN|nr:two-component sensor histidine kinase [Planotetraspora thailandica]
MWGGSIRGRITLLVTMLAVVVLVPTGLLAGSMVRHAVTDTVWHDAQRQSNAVAADVRAGRLDGTITPTVAGITLVQVVAPDDRILAASPDARGLPPLTSVWPRPDNPQMNVRACPPGGNPCLDLSALRVHPAADSPVIYAGRPAGGPSSQGMFDWLFAAEVLGLVLLTAWGAWKIAGRTLRPVEDIRAELASINVVHQGNRVAEPPGHDEIARLARTVNNTLIRIEDAKLATEEALQRQRQFAADASHELRTPLAGLRAQLEEARLHPSETDLPAVLQQTLHDVDRLETIVTDLLLLARVGANPSGERRPVDLASLAEDQAARRLEAVEISMTLEAGLTVMGSRTHLSRLVANLLDNAVRHARHAVRVRVYRAGTSGELSVSDDGAGIKPADRERVFERFTRLDTARSRDRGGSGLGLAIAREIAVAHKGVLWVEDAPEGGARFVVRLPLAAPDGLAGGGPDQGRSQPAEPLADGASAARTQRDHQGGTGLDGREAPGADRSDGSREAGRGRQRIQRSVECPAS